MDLPIRPSEDEFGASRPTGRWCRSGRSCWPTSRRPSGCSRRWRPTGRASSWRAWSARERWGRYSFVAGDPAAIVVVDGDGLRVRASRPATSRFRRRRGRAAPLGSAQGARRCAARGRGSPTSPPSSAA